MIILNKLYLSASPFSVRLEIYIGSNGSSVPETVIPKGPPCLTSSTVYTIAHVASGSSEIE